MLINSFQDGLFAHIAARKLGLTLYDPEEIRTSSYFAEIEEGDLFLQYRRPSFTSRTRGIYGDPVRYTGEQSQQLPVLIRDNGLDFSDIGFLNRWSEASLPAFRIFYVEEITQKNDMLTKFKALPAYGDGWAFEQRPARLLGGYCPGRWERPTYVPYRRSFSIRYGDREEGRGRTGIIGKFDRETLTSYFNATTASTRYNDDKYTRYDPKQKFYPLWRALVSDEIERPSVVTAIRKAMQESSPPM